MTFHWILKSHIFPSGFLNYMRKEMGLESKLQSLKTFARKEGIEYDTNDAARNIFNELYRKASES